MEEPPQTEQKPIDSVPESRSEPLEVVLLQLSSRINEQNDLLREQLAYHRSIRERIVAGMWMGLGTVLGATVLFTLLAVAVRPLLKPLSNFSWVGPIVDRVLEDMESRQRRAPYYRQDAPAPDPKPAANPSNPAVPVQEESVDENVPKRSLPGDNK